MDNSMRNLLLSVALIAIPVTGFALVETTSQPATQTAESAGLGDLSAFEMIVSDTRGLAQKGNIALAERRISDFEKLWDDNASALRKADAATWGSIDDAADATFSALRARNPEPAKVETALVSLQAALLSPAGDLVKTVQAAQMISGIAVTDNSGHALPCEEMIAQVRARLGTTTPTAAVTDLQAKALERCNADDDSRADAFAAKALAQIKG